MSTLFYCKSQQADCTKFRIEFCAIFLLTKEEKCGKMAARLVSPRATVLCQVHFAQIF